MSSETCESAIELEMLASGMAKQHENYFQALQELIDSAVAAKVDDESSSRRRRIQGAQSGGIRATQERKGARSFDL